MPHKLKSTQETPTIYLYVKTVAACGPRRLKDSVTTLPHSLRIMRSTLRELIHELRWSDSKGSNRGWLSAKCAHPY